MPWDGKELRGGKQVVQALKLVAGSYTHLDVYKRQPLNIIFQVDVVYRLLITSIVMKMEV